MKVTKGQTVWVSRSGRGIKETTVNSSGKKYVTLSYDSRIRFDSETLREVDGTGCSSFIITDIEKYNIDQRYSEMRSTLKKFVWGSMEREDIDKVMAIVRNYE